MGDSKLQLVQQQIDDTTHLMHQNIEIVIARGDNLADLEVKAQHLEHGATHFLRQSNKLVWQQRWNTYKPLIAAGLIVSVLLVIILAIAGVFS